MNLTDDELSIIKNILEREVRRIEARMSENSALWPHGATVSDLSQWVVRLGAILDKLKVVAK